MAFLTQIAGMSTQKEPGAYEGPFAQSLEILVLQPTPFCNIDCDYCYLPNRNDTRRMDLNTIRAAVTMVLEGGLIDGCLCVVWHAGEPLVLPVHYYEEAFEVIQQTVQGRCEISHSIQSNGILIDDLWCEFFKRMRVRIGLSIDGPAFLHDLHRMGRQGGATHAQTMRGAQKLRDHGVPFHVICVVSADSLDHASEIFHFFEELEITEVGFNIEELEGNHSCSSLGGHAMEGRIEKFWLELYKLSESSNGNLRIREFERAMRAILTSQAKQPLEEIARHNNQVLPFRIVSVDHSGRVSTFSPELLGLHDPCIGDFTFGRVGHENLAAIQSSEGFQQVANEIWKGVRACAATCEYFSVCGGGAPSNKYFENGSFSSTTTMYCRAAIQLPLKVALDDIEKKLKIGARG
jgi:uncharacterized protein